MQQDCSTNAAAGCDRTRRGVTMYETANRKLLISNERRLMDFLKISEKNKKDLPKSWRPLRDSNSRIYRERVVS